MSELGKLCVHLGYTLPDDHRVMLQSQLLPNIVCTMGEAPPDEVYHVLVAGRPTEILLDASPYIRALIIPFAGLPAITAERLKTRPHVAVYNLHHNAPPTAEMALTLLLSVAKRIVPADRDFRQHDWRPRYLPYPAVQLRGKRALILGYGAVGRYLADLLRPLGMEVQAIRRSETSEQEVYTPDHLHELLPSADVLFICTPGTPETDGMIGRRELSLLHPGAMLINVGRANVVDPVALYEVLHDGHLYGAGLDVWYHYPDSIESRSHTPPADVPFHTLDNVVMSPHRAGGGGNADVEALRLSALAQALNQFARGDVPSYRVYLERGY